MQKEQKKIIEKIWKELYALENYAANGIDDVKTNDEIRQSIRKTTHIVERCLMKHIDSMKNKKRI